MDTSRLSQGEKIVAISSGLLVLLSFFPLWGKYEFPGGVLGGSERVSAWSNAFNFLSKLAILLALTALVLVILKALGTNLELPIGTGLTYVALGGLSTLLLVLLLIIGPREFGLGSVPGVEVSRGIMQFVGVVLGAGVLFGGYQHMQGETTGPSSPTTPPATPPPAS